MMIITPVALVVSRDPWATAVLALGAGVSTFCFGSVLLFRFRHFSCSQQCHYPAVQITDQDARTWTIAVTMKVASVWILIVSGRQAFSPVAAHQTFSGQAGPLLGQYCGKPQSYGFWLDDCFLMGGAHSSVPGPGHI
jgi:hypothetical protein